LPRRASPRDSSRRARIFGHYTRSTSSLPIRSAGGERAVAGPVPRRSRRFSRRFSRRSRRFSRRQRDDKHHRAEQGRRQSGRQEWQGQEPVERKPGDHRERPTKRRPNDDLRGIYRAIHRGTLNPRSLSISPCRLLRFRPTVRLGSGATELKVSITSPLIPHLQRSEPDQKSFDYVAAVDTGCRTLQSLFFVCAISGNDNAAPTVAMSRAAVGCHGE